MYERKEFYAEFFFVCYFGFVFSLLLGSMDNGMPFFVFFFFPQCILFSLPSYVFFYSSSLFCAGIMMQRVQVTPTLDFF